MRKIKFRGKAIMSTEELENMGIKHDNGWVYGNFIRNGNRPMIVGNIVEENEESIYLEFWVVAHPESVGQYTGTKDKNRREIYERDVVEGYVVRFDEERGGFFPFANDDGCGCCSEVVLDSDYVEVIGNIYDNPELLEESQC